MNPNPEEHDAQDEYGGRDGYDPFTARGPEYDSVWAPAGDRYERMIDDRYSRSLDFTDLDYEDEEAEGE